MLRFLFRPKLGWGLTSILTLSTLSVIALLMTLTTVLEVRRQRTIFRDGLEERAGWLAKTLNQVLADPLYHADVDSLQDIADIVESQPDINGMLMFTPDGRVLADAFHDMPQSSYAEGFVTDDFGLSTVGSMTTNLRYRGSALEVATPIEIAGEVIGVVQFGFSTVKLDEEIRAIVLWHVWQGVVLMAIGAALAYLLARRLTRPLQALTAVAEEIGQGNMENPVVAGGSREVMVLAHSLEWMRVEVKRLYSGLEERVRERTQELEAANKELEAFSYSVSHDLRSPLQSIEGFSHALVEDCYEALGEQGRDHLQRVRAAARRMAALIDDLLTLSRTTLTELTPAAVDLTTTARDIAAELTTAGPERSVEFEIEDGMGVKGEPRLLKVALENLMGNAWKFTRDRDPGHIAVGTTRTNGQLAFFVRDNGAGFDPTYADKLFGPFQRLHSASEFEGTGIGLATVQRIIGRHGGRIWAEGTPDAGATFYFVLDRRGGQ